MKYGMVRAGAFTPEISVGDPAFNAEAIVKAVAAAHARGVEIAVFPELCITGYTAGDLFFTRKLLASAAAGVKAVAAAAPSGMLVFIGAPVELDGRLYNCAIALSGGRVLGITPKTELPDYGEFYETRYFAPAFDGTVHNAEYDAPMGNVLYECNSYDRLVVGCEICEDMWADVSPSVEQARAGATVIVNLSASDEIVGKAEYRELLIGSVSGRLHCAYVYADAGAGESSGDMVFSAHNVVAENGAALAVSKPFDAGEAVCDVDIERLVCERMRVGVKPAAKKFVRVPFALENDKEFSLCREIGRYPFVPEGDDAARRAELILNIQTAGLKRRFKASRSSSLVIGVSGGLDSALALLVCKRAVPAHNVVAVTMPCFGTTERTLGNARKLCDALGIALRVIDIKNTVKAHLSDLEHDATDVVYENAQARVRTMTLFDLANKTNGIVVGTGDLSELALGWCTYNGDHMASYGVNCGVPKTLVKRLVAYEADRLGGKARAALNDILGTDISPELLPPQDGAIAQKTEDILGKYDLLDFIMYYYCRYGFTREKIEFLLRAAYVGTPDEQFAKALDTFFGRFFVSQFKRSCMPDGVKVGSVSFSPRSDFRLPSDLLLF